MLFILGLFFSSYTFARPEVEAAKLSIKSLLAPILASKTPAASGNKFRVDQCPREKINWMNVVMMKEEVALNYKFGPGCDIQGSIRPKIFRPFPAQLNLRNIEPYNKIQAENKITALLQNPPILNLEIKSGLLTGKNSLVKFEADYQVQINPLAQGAIDKNLGGELRISEINGKKVNIKEKILIK